MKTNLNILKASIGIAMLSSLPTTVHAHGWSEFPSARQNTCYEQGGVWSGNPPNAACAQAKEMSGSYPFVQRNEFSRNVIDYTNMAAVKAAVPDGTLCYANDPQKKGMGAPHTDWSRTEINAGTFEYVFNATAPHDPSYWEFYLTKPNADLSKALAWGDLELIQTENNAPINGGKYRMNVTIPSDRSGDAILFVRWQRADAAGEGFYNCSDITITSDGATHPVEPTPEPQANLVKGDQFIPVDFVAPQLGDTVKYDIINKHGEIARSFNIEVNAANINDWQRLLASEINGWHAEYKDGAVFIGDWHAEMSHYMYFKNDASRNTFNSKDGRASGVISVIENSDNAIAPLTGDIFELVSSDKVVNAGDKVVIALDEAANLTQAQGTTVMIQNNGSAFIIVDTAAVTRSETLSFVANAVNGDRTDTFTFEVIAKDQVIAPEVKPETKPEVKPEPTPVPTPDGNVWNAATVYLGGEIVSYAGQNWKAGWWVQGGDNPQATFQDNIWGVWRPAN